MLWSCFWLAHQPKREVVVDPEPSSLSDGQIRERVPETSATRRLKNRPHHVSLMTWTLICSSFLGFVMDFGSICGTEPPKGTTNGSSGSLCCDDLVGCN